MPKTPSRSLDKFYTRPEIARRCVARVIDVVGQRPGPFLWLEPSAGDGAFLDLLPQPRLGVDIAPGCPEIVRTDFLTWVPPRLADTIVCVGNPPFGKNASLALKFVNHAARFSSVVAFILPRTFEKESFKAKVAPAFGLAFQEVLPLDSFAFDGEPYEVPTVFQIWSKWGKTRKAHRRIFRHPDFDFVGPGEADFAFQRVGARAGLVSVEGLKKSPQSHYFIKVANHARPVFDIIKGLVWIGIKDCTAGNPSIGKAELVAAYAKVAG